MCHQQQHLVAFGQVETCVLCAMSSTWLLSNFRKAGHETGGAAHVKICSVGCAAARQIQRVSRPVQSHSLWHRTSQCCRANQTESVPVMATVVGRLDTLTADLRHLGAMIESSRYISSLTDMMVYTGPGMAQYYRAGTSSNLCLTACIRNRPRCLCTCE